MHRLIYVSTATPAFTDEDIAQILAGARVRNASFDVTARLLHLNNDFLQVLEGSRGSVETVFRSIARDYRHGAITTLISKPVQARELANEPISYDQLIEAPETEGLFRLTRAALASSLTAAASLQSVGMIRTFINGGEVRSLAA